MKPFAPTNDLAMPFAYNGDKTIIPAEEATTGRATLSQGFPYETQIPIREGGVAPTRNDFNGAFYMLSALNFWKQSGGMMSWKSTLSYVPPAIVYHNGDFWACVAENGPDTSAGNVTPGTNDNYWLSLFAYLVANSDGGKVTLEGDVTGSGSFDKSGNVVVPTTVDLGTGGLVPAGTIAFYAGSSVPDGWLICNGSTVSRTTYADLYAAIGTSWGSGNGSTTFGLPDFRNRMPQGIGNYSLGTSIAGAVPEISGHYTLRKFHSDEEYDASFSVGGAFTKTTNGGSSVHNHGRLQYLYDYDGEYITFSAAKSNSSYSGSTVQPPALAVYYIIKY